MLRTTEICHLLQKLLHGPVGSMQTHQGSWGETHEVSLDVHCHKPPSSTSCLPFRPAGQLPKGNTDLSAGERFYRLVLRSTPGNDEHMTAPDRKEKKGKLADYVFFLKIFLFSLEKYFVYHHNFARTLANHSNSHPLVIYFFIVKEVWKKEGGWVYCAAVISLHISVIEFWRCNQMR